MAPLLANCYGGLQYLDEAVERHENSYAGEWGKLADYAANYCENCSPVPDWLEPYVDFEAMARDWDTNGDIDATRTLGATRFMYGCGGIACAD